MAILSKIVEGLTNNEEYFARVFAVNPKGRVNNRIDLPYVSAVPSAFPQEPTSYELIDTYTTATTFSAPEDGWYQIEVFGASGKGGNGDALDWDLEEDYEFYSTTCLASGGGGGGGAYASSIVKLNKGDTVVITNLDISKTAAVYINSSIEIYSNILVKSGGNGRNGTCVSSSELNPGSAGTGGTASGGNIANVNGNDAGSGSTFKKQGAYITASVTCAGGNGGAAINGGNAGGKGGGLYIRVTGSRMNKATAIAAGAGKAGFVKIYRGNTNVA